MTTDRAIRTSRSGLARRLRRQDGSILPMVAMLMVVILGMAAFAIDISGLYVSQRHLQFQADAAVLAGANQYVKNPGSTCASQKTAIQQVATQYAGVGSGAVSSNNEAGAVSATVNVDCTNAYVDASLTNSSPPSFFSGIFGVHPTVGAHARASLLQVTQEGGSQVLPYAISQSQAVFNNQLIQIPINAGNTKQALLCDGSGAANAGSAVEMYNLQVNGCPLTQANSGGNTCPSSSLNPPSCLYEFTGVDESSGFDKGHVYRFENGQPWPGATSTCTNPTPIPTNNYAQYLANGTLVAGDPRVITVFVVPDGAMSQSGGLIPIVGYATFYMEGWDHDPCDGKGKPDPVNPGPLGDKGTIWGYFIAYTAPASSTVSGTSTTPCNPNPAQAWTYNCTFALTQ
jgi:hypothetical protein